MGDNTDNMLKQIKSLDQTAAFHVLCRHMDIQRSEKIGQLKAAVGSAAVPLPAELLQTLMELFPADADEALRAHPGFGLWKLIQSYRTSLEVFEHAFEDLDRAIARFEEASREGLLFSQLRNSELKAFERAVQKEMFAAAHAAHALIEHSGRQLQPFAQITDYEAKRHESFGSDGLHETIIGLRNILHHFHMVQPGWQWRRQFGPEAETTYHFTLVRDDLLQAATERKDKLSGFNRIESFLSKSPDKIDIRRMFADYRSRAGQFHSWFAAVIEGDEFEAVRDYERCRKEIKKAGDRTSCNALLGNWLQWKTPPNPYDHLDTYLTPAQIEEVYRLPMGSPEQVDRIIAIVDEDGACNESIRKQAYELFRRAVPKPIPNQHGG